MRPLWAGEESPVWRSYSVRTFWSRDIKVDELVFVRTHTYSSACPTSFLIDWREASITGASWIDSYSYSERLALLWPSSAGPRDTHKHHKVTNAVRGIRRGGVHSSGEKALQRPNRSQQITSRVTSTESKATLVVIYVNFFWKSLHTQRMAMLTWRLCYLRVFDCSYCRTTLEFLGW